MPSAAVVTVRTESVSTALAYARTSAPATGSPPERTVPETTGYGARRAATPVRPDVPTVRAVEAARVVWSSQNSGFHQPSGSTYPTAYVPGSTWTDQAPVLSVVASCTATPARVVTATSMPERPAPDVPTTLPDNATGAACAGATPSSVASTETASSTQPRAAAREAPMRSPFSHQADEPPA